MKTKKDFILPILEGLFFIILIIECRYEFLSKNMLFLLFAMYSPVMFLSVRKKWKEDQKKSSLIFMIISFLIMLAFILKIIFNLF